MNIQNLSLLLSDKVSKRKIFSKFKAIGDFYSKSFDERKNIITAKLSFTLKKFEIVGGQISSFVLL